MKSIHRGRFSLFLFGFVLFSFFPFQSRGQFTKFPTGDLPLYFAPMCLPLSYLAPTKIVNELCERVDACTAEDGGYNGFGCGFIGAANTDIGDRLGLNAGGADYTGNVIQIQQDIRFGNSLVNEPKLCRCLSAVSNAPCEVVTTNFSPANRYAHPDRVIGTLEACENVFLPVPSAMMETVATPKTVIAEFCNLVMNSLTLSYDSRRMTESEARPLITSAQLAEKRRCVSTMNVESSHIWDEMGLTGEDGRYSSDALRVAILLGEVSVNRAAVQECHDWIWNYTVRASEVRAALGDLRMSITSDADTFSINYSNAGSFFTASSPCSRVFHRVR